jgi:hypothetical protein
VVGVDRKPTVVERVPLEGRFVRLEPLTMGHVAGLLAAAAGSRDTYGFTLVPRDEAETRAYVQAALDEQEAGRALPFATVDRARGLVVGSTRFFNIEFWPWPRATQTSGAPGARTWWRSAGRGSPPRRAAPINRGEAPDAGARVRPVAVHRVTS